MGVYIQLTELPARLGYHRIVRIRSRPNKLFFHELQKARRYEPRAHGQTIEKIYLSRSVSQLVYFVGILIPPDRLGKAPVL